MAFEINPQSGVGPGQINIKPTDYNTSGGDISQRIRVNIGGKYKEINLIQKAATIGWNYTFNISPSSVTLEPGGSSTTVSITSTRQKTINGISVGEVEQISYSAIHYSGAQFVSVNGNEISAGANDNTYSRDEVIRFTQEGSGNTWDVSISQAANVHYYFSASNPSATVDYTTTSYNPGIESYRMVGSRREEVGYQLISDTSGMTANSSNFSFSQNQGKENRTFYGRAIQNDTGQSISLQVTQEGVPYYSYIGTRFTDLNSGTATTGNFKKIRVTNRYSNFYTADFEVADANSPVRLKALDKEVYTGKFTHIRISGDFTLSGSNLILSKLSGIALFFSKSGDIDMDKATLVESLINENVSGTLVFMDINHVGESSQWGGPANGYNAGNSVLGNYYRFKLIPY